MGSSAYSFAMVARGSALLGFDATPKIWDLSAVWLLIKEAGGFIQPFEDKPLFPIAVDLDYNTTSFPTLAAATPQLLEQGHMMIQKK